MSAWAGFGCSAARAVTFGVADSVSTGAEARDLPASLEAFLALGFGVPF